MSMQRFRVVKTALSGRAADRVNEVVERTRPRGGLRSSAPGFFEHPAVRIAFGLLGVYVLIHDFLHFSPGSFRSWIEVVYGVSFIGTGVLKSRKRNEWSRDAAYAFRDKKTV